MGEVDLRLSLLDSFRRETGKKKRKKTGSKRIFEFDLIQALKSAICRKTPNLIARDNNSIPTREK